VTEKAGAGQQKTRMRKAPAKEARHRKGGELGTERFRQRRKSGPPTGTDKVNPCAREKRPYVSESGAGRDKD